MPMKLISDNGDVTLHHDELGTVKLTDAVEVPVRECLFLGSDVPAEPGDVFTLTRTDSPVTVVLEVDGREA